MAATRPSSSSQEEERGGSSWSSTTSVLESILRWFNITTEADDDDAAHIIGKSVSVGSGLEALATGLTKRLAADAAAAGSNLVFSPVSFYSALALVAAGATRGRALDELLGVLGASSLEELAEFVGGLVVQALADRSQIGGPARVVSASGARGRPTLDERLCILLGMSYPDELATQALADRTGGPRIIFASGVWHDKTTALRRAYRDTVESYKTETRAVDFRHKPEEAGKEINRWVAAATDNLIDSIVDPSSFSSSSKSKEHTIVVLANALYFKGKWEVPFRKEHTKKDKFHRLDGSTVAGVPFMRSHGGYHHVICHKGFKVLKLPYERRRATPPSSMYYYSMCIFLPDARDGLLRLVGRIARGPAGFMREHLPTTTALVRDLRLPSFKLASSFEMAGVLRRLGVAALKDADMSDMVEDPSALAEKLVVKQIVHSAHVEVNEEGTVARAFTIADFDLGCSLVRKPEPVVDFIADHPFAFFVMEEVSGAIMFAGHVIDPSSST